jgi:hypothetical protein
MYLAKKYEGHNISVGIGSTTISLIRKTVVKDLTVTLKTYNIPYVDNKDSNIITIGTVQFFLIATEYPVNIYGYNLHFFLLDELDELSIDRANDCWAAVNERTRLPLPDGGENFIFVSTTAQGYKATYAIYRQLKEKKEKFVLIRGKTKDNIYNKASYYTRLYNLYNENERLAFLEGYFVNLTTGVVYPDFNEDYAVISPIEYSPTCEVFVGQDLNTGYSKATCIVKQDGILYVVKTFSFDIIGNAPETLRNNFPKNDIYWFPDCSAKEILNGYIAEMDTYNINRRFGTQNPSILERIFMVNKLLKTGRLKIFNTCQDLILALKIRQFDKMGKPEKPGGENDPSHLDDSLEYVIFRIVSSDPDFFDISRK